MPTTPSSFGRADRIRRSARRVALAVIFTGCGAEPSNTTFGAGLAQTACGPTDGPAMEIQLAVAPAAEPNERPNLQVMIYRSRTDAAGRSWRLEPALNAAAAAYCPEAGACESATRGTVELDPTVTTGTVSGILEARFPIKGLVRGRFQVEWRDRLLQCG